MAVQEHCTNTDTTATARFLDFRYEQTVWEHFHEVEMELWSGDSRVEEQSVHFGCRLVPLSPVMANFVRKSSVLPLRSHILSCCTTHILAAGHVEIHFHHSELMPGISFRFSLLACLNTCPIHPTALRPENADRDFSSVHSAPYCPARSCKTQWNKSRTIETRKKW